MQKNVNPKVTIQNFPEDIQCLPRRRFVQGLFGVAAAAVWPSFKLSGIIPSFSCLEDTAVKLEGIEAGEESFWKLVKNQFMIREGLIMMNAANLCPSPYSVQHRMFELTRDVDIDVSYNNRNKFYDLQEESRNALARYLGASPEEIAITRNTSESNNMVINGLTFKRGDEVVIWDENHPTANEAWNVRAERYGFTVKRVRMPAIFSKSEELIQSFVDAITPRTRLLCFSHVSNLSGIALPVREICRTAHERNILVHVDGAQTFGLYKIDLHDLQCDFYTGSAHKWFVGPKEVGVLYVRKELIANLWPTIVGVGYPDVLDKGARKFETLGQRDDSKIAAMAAAVRFHETIGPARIEARVRSLTAELKCRLRERIPQVEFRTPLEPELSGGVVVFKVPGMELNQAMDTLYQKYSIGCAVFEGDLAGIRLCPHIYNTMAEIGRVVDSIEQYAAARSGTTRESLKINRRNTGVYEGNI